MISSPSTINYTPSTRLAECRGLAPLARRHALVSTEARFACPVDIPKWCPWQELHLHCRRFELRASALGYTGDRNEQRRVTNAECKNGPPCRSILHFAFATPHLEIVPTVGFAPTLCAF